MTTFDTWRDEILFREFETVATKDTEPRRKFVENLLATREGQLWVPIETGEQVHGWLIPNLAHVRLSLHNWPRMRFVTPELRRYAAEALAQALEDFKIPF